jgi:ABC-type phosphate transport system auxiliary subunit
MSSLETLDRGAALLREQQQEQQCMKRFDAVVPEDVVHDSEMLEKSLSALRVSLKAEQLEAELAAESEARERAEAQNAALNARLAVLAAQLQEVCTPRAARSLRIPRPCAAAARAFSALPHLARRGRHGARI